MSYFARAYIDYCILTILVSICSDSLIAEFCRALGADMELQNESSLLQAGDRDPNRPKEL